ncbi:methyl-accepting chemotaxis protein, partial [Natrialba swarupiae]
MSRSDGGATDTDVDTGRRIQTFDVGSADVNRARELASLRPDDERTLESIAHVFAAERDDLATGFVEAVREHPAADALDRDELDGSLEREQRELLEELPHGECDAAFFDRRISGDETATLLAAGPDAYLGSREVYYEGILRAIADDVKAEYAPETDLEPVEDERTDGGAVTTNADSPNGVSDAVDAVVDRALAFVRVANVDEQLAMRAYASARDDEVEAYEAKLERQQSKLDDYERQIEEYEAKLERTEDSREALETATERVKSSVDEVRSVSDDVTRRTERIDDLADEQEGSINEIAGEISGLSATVEEIASNAEEVSATSERAEELTDDTTDTAQEA